jgi:hypothetical protein
MNSDSVAHFCVKCLAANPVGQELCGRCGTRLMLVVESMASRYEDIGISGAHEEHLLERVSALENRLSRLTEKLEQSLTLFLKAAAEAGTGPAPIEKLLGVLLDAGVISSSQFDEIACTTRPSRNSSGDS